MIKQYTLKTIILNKTEKWIQIEIISTKYEILGIYFLYIEYKNIQRDKINIDQ